MILNSGVEKKWFDVKEAAEYICLEADKVYKLAKKGKLMAYRNGERKIVFDIVDLDQYIKSRPYTTNNKGNK